MVNPSRPKNQLIGVYHLEVLRLYQYVYQNLDVGHILVHSLGGYDEISLTSDIRIIKRDSDQVTNPESLGFTTLQEKDLFGGSTIKEAADIFVNVLNNACTSQQKSVVIANAAMAIQCSKPELSYEDSIAMAKESIDSKAAFKVFENLVNHES